MYNFIRKIENLDKLKKLRYLNLEGNLVDKIENLENLNITTLRLPKNHLKSIESIRGLIDCPSLEIIDLKNNEIPNEDDIFGVFSVMPNLKTLYLNFNPC